MRGPSPRLVVLRSLDLQRASQRGRPRHLSAASGLVRVGKYAYVIADDEHHLGMFRSKGRAPGSLVRLRGGALPADKKARKRRKPDFEALVALPPFAGCPAGALLAMGSGSRPNRCAGALLPLDASGAIAGRVRNVDLTPWYEALGREFREVNIEGAFVGRGVLSLLQRGNRGEARSARIEVSLASVLDALAAGRDPPRAALGHIVNFQLGAIDGVPIAFTDGAALGDGGFAFTAVAEGSGDSYADGPCVGSAIGIADADDRLRALWRLEPALKVEGIAIRESRGAIELTVVTDADDFNQPAHVARCRLGLAELPGGPV